MEIFSSVEERDVMLEFDEEYDMAGCDGVGDEAHTAFDALAVRRSMRRLVGTQKSLVAS